MHTSARVLISRRAQTGVSLVELMIAMTLGLMVMATIGYAYIGSRKNFDTLNALSRMQESARYAFETMAHDLRMAGFTGCVDLANAVNVLNSPTTWYENLIGQPLIGFEEGSTFPSGVSNVLRGDAITVLRTDNSKEYLIASHTPASAQMQLTANHDIKQGEILVAMSADCQHAAIFQMTNVNNNNTIATIVHNNGNATTPGNCTKGLGSPLDCATANGTAYTFAANSRVMRLSAVTYYIRNNGSGEPALYRQTLGASGGNATTSAVEVAEGVQNMQLSYGLDTNADGAVDVYQTAASVTNWAQVLSVRVSLLMVSRSDEAIATKPQAYTYNGTTVTPTDNLMRKVVNATIAIRNRL